MESKQPPPPPSIFRRLVDIDAAVSLHLHSIAQPILPRSLLKALEISGDGRLFFPLAVSLFLSPLSITSSHHLRSLLADLLIGAVLDILLIGLLKHLIRRPRPVYNKDMFLTFAVDHWSFPSGHASRVCFIASFLSLSSALIGDTLVQLRSSGVEFVDKLFNWIYFDDAEVTHFLVLAVISWACATSISRVLLGRHFFCDVLAGAFLGVAEALVVFQFFNHSILVSKFFS